MPLYTSKSVLLGLTALFSAAAFTASADEITTYTKDGVAIGGTDPVAYFTEGKPVAGSNDYTFEYDDVTWKFASADNRDTFAADPAKYAPQYGGFCAMGMALGKKLDGDPNVWKIVDNKLYLNVNKDVSVAWQRNLEGNINTADENWPELKHRTPASLN